MMPGTLYHQFIESNGRKEFGSQLWRQRLESPFELEQKQ